MQRARDRRFRVRGTEQVFHAGVSIGVAAAPADGGNGKDLFHAADTALYHAKQSGRGQLADAAQIELTQVFSRTALHRLKAIGISGRQTELERVSAALEDLSAGRSAFLTVEAAAGFGKSAFLETIAGNLSANKDFRLIRASGVPQEAYRSYYLATSILIELLKARHSTSGLDLHDLSADEIDTLAHLVPQLSGGRTKHLQAADGEARAAIFTTLIQCIPRLADSRPMVFLIDDLQFADEATLYLLGALLRNPDIELIVCGARMESVDLGGEDAETPLDRFLAEYGRELEVQRIKLGPLGREAIADHLHGVFPNLQMPDGFDADLEEITLGNPLFITEIIRKLVRDQKATLVGQEWVIQPLSEDYLPKSLEEVVGEMITALDQESRALLEQASALGEDVPVSVLTGSSEVDEHRVLQFLDRAESLGLVELDFQVNDEIMRFLGKRVMEISYGTIDEGRRKELHERVANYQEALFKDRLMPSASLLAYHFKRSANQEKARLYQQMQVHYGQTFFQASEAAVFIAPAVDTGIYTGEPLTEESLAIVPEVLRGLLTSVRSVQLYPKDSDAVTGSGRQVQQALEQILANNERLTLTYSEDGGLEVNGEEVELRRLSGIAPSFVALLKRSRLQGLAFLRPVDGDELAGLIDAVAGLTPGKVEGGFWRQYAIDQDLRSIELKQTSYSRVLLEDEGLESHAPVRLPGQEQLEAEDVAAVPEILRAFTKTAKNVKLYPVHSAPAERCIQEFRDALEPVLRRKPVIGLSRTEDSLLANGAVVNTSDYELLADTFLDLMDSLGLRSIAFLSGTRKAEIEGLFAAIREIPHTGPEDDFWERFMAQRHPGGIRVNHEYYSLVTGSGQYFGPPDALGDGYPAAAHPAAGAPAGATAQVDGATGQVQVAYAAVPPGEYEPLSGVPGAPLPPGAVPAAGFPAGATSGVPLPPGAIGVPPGVPFDAETGYYGPATAEDAGESLQELGKELLVEGQDDLFEQLLQKVFDGFQQRDPQQRADTLTALSDLMDDLILGLQHKFAALTGSVVLDALEGEEDPGVLEQGVALIHSMASVALQMSDNRTAATYYASLAGHSARRQHADEDDRDGLREILNRSPDDNARRIVQTDLRSGDPARLSNATLVLNGLGEAGIPVLIETIKEEKDLRVRQAAASILADMGPVGAEYIKRELMLEVIVEQRFNLLEVIETVTTDLHDELSICLGDANPKIRRAAFRLAERLHHEGLVDVLEPLARDEDTAVAKGAVRSLTSLGTDDAAKVLISVLEHAKDPEIAVACCQALGHFGGPAAIAALSRVLSRRKLFVLGPVWGDQVRATAAMVLSNIADPGAVAVLKRFVDDKDSRIRRIAGAAGPSGKPRGHRKRRSPAVVDQPQ